jgi:hypothetical protein
VTKATSDNWGTPDPRDPDAYTDPSTTSMPQWAWEFLRRRDDYRRVWQARVQPFVDGDRFNVATIARDNLEALHRTVLEPRVPPWDALRDDFKVYGYPVYRTLHNRTLDPRIVRPPWFVGRGVTTVGTYGCVMPDFMRLVVIDLRLPLEPQWEDAKVALRLAAAGDGVTQASAVRPQDDKFPTYLRLLDFRESGSPNREIHEHLFPKLRDKSDEVLHVSINQSLKQAHRWQHNYWRLALHSPT